MIRKTWKLRLFILLFGLCAVPPAVAEMVPTPDIRRIESYLNGLRTIEARFVQNNPNGSYAVGKLYVQKPGKLRFEYDPPVPLLLIADGSWLFQVDKELKQVSQYPLFDTPAQFLLNERIVFGKEFGVINFQRHAKTVRIEESSSASSFFLSSSSSLRRRARSLRS